MVKTVVKKDLFGRGVNTFRGTKDYFGDDVRKRQAVIQIIKEVFELFGFELLETPAIENERTLKGKYGAEGEKKRFRLGQDGGLRYDQTVPLARFMTMNWNRFPMPYRRYVVGQVWRNESAAAGRLREFTQCDFDTVGSSSPIVDAEVVAMNYSVLDRLNFGDRYKILINDRRLLDALGNALRLKTADLPALYRAWDKIEKADWPSILEDLKKEGFDKDCVSRVNEATIFLQDTSIKNNDAILDAIKVRFPTEAVIEAVASLQKLLIMIRSFKVPEDRFKMYPLLARGLDYYTGPIFETIVTEGGVGSITGGGRFDRLINTLGGPDLPASGSSFGLERIMKVMDDLQIPYPNIDSPEVFIAVFDATDIKYVQASLALASKLRLDKIKVEVYTGDNKKLSKQFDIASRKKFKFVLVIGPEEIGNSTVSVKNLLTGQRQTVDQDKVTSTIEVDLR